MGAGEVVALTIGILGVAGIIFSALKYNRDDTTALVGQQDVIVGEMKTMMDEWRTTAADLRLERDELRVQVERLTSEISALREELREEPYGR